MDQDLNTLLKTMMGSIPAVDGEGIALPSVEKTVGLRGSNLYSIIIDELLRQPSITQDQLRLIQTLLPYTH